MLDFVYLFRSLVFYHGFWLCQKSLPPNNHKHSEPVTWDTTMVTENCHRNYKQSLKISIPVPPLSPLIREQPTSVLLFIWLQLDSDLTECFLKGLAEMLYLNHSPLCKPLVQDKPCLWANLTSLSLNKQKQNTFKESWEPFLKQK